MGAGSWAWERARGHLPRDAGRDNAAVLIALFLKGLYRSGYRGGSRAWLRPGLHSQFWLLVWVRTLEDDGLSLGLGLIRVN